MTFFSGRSGQLNLVRSDPTRDINPESDSRRSSFSFAWKGLATGFGIEEVERVLSFQAPDLAFAVRELNTEEIEYAIAPLIYECMRINEQRLRSLRGFVLAGALYLAVGVVVVATVLIQMLIRALQAS